MIRSTLSENASVPADLIVVAERIHTVDDDVPFATACAIRDGRFIYVGTPDEALGLRGRTTRVLDAAGATVLPGLIDAHVHFLGVGHALHAVDLTGVTSMAEIVDRTVAFAERHDDVWIVGARWDHARFPDGRFPSHDSLSRALLDRPVVLYRIDGHAILANARAMALAGITETATDPAGGQIVRDRSGALTGVFIDNAQSLVTRVLPLPAHDRNVAAARAAQHEFHRFGVTAVAEAGVDDAALAAYDELAERGELTIRNYAMLSGRDSALLERRIAAGPVRDAHDGRLSVRAIKLFADGALGSRGAALWTPYSDDPSTDGLIVTPPATIETVCDRALAAGFQVCTHAIGDRANHLVLDAYERALQRTPVADHRFRIEHAQVLAKADVPRFARLGIIPSMQTSHHDSDRPWVEQRLGAERLEGAYAWRALLSTGARIANGTDAPIEPADPRRTFYAAIAAGSNAMTRDEALRSMTIWAAYASFMEREIGSISPAKCADFTILDRDVMTVEPGAILGARVLATYSAGKPVYEAS